MANSQFFKRPIFNEGVVLFFPVAAIYAILMPFTYISFFDLTFPGSDYIVPQQWHGHEMVFGFFSSALAGFLTSAVAEWTNTKPIKGKKLALLLLIWLPGRIIGFFGIDFLMIPGSVTDFTFLLYLFFLVAMPILKKKQTRAISFIFWLALLFILEVWLRWTWWQQDVLLASRLLSSEIIIFVVLFELSTSRINIVVFNLALDPSGKQSPYRPHPGRRYLASFLVALYGISAFFFPQSEMQYYLAFGAAAGYFDRLAEWFIGIALFKTEVLCLGLSNLSAGLGFFLIGLTGFMPNISPYLGLHILTIAMLGLAVMGVFTIAGLRHTGRRLTDMPWQPIVAIALIVAAASFRVLPQLVDDFPFSDRQYQISSLCWSLAFLVWLTGYLPLLLHPKN